MNASRDGEAEEIADLDLRDLSDTDNRFTSFSNSEPTILACSCRHRSWQGSITPSSVCSSSGTQPLPMASSDISFHMRALQMPKSAELSVFASLSSMSSVGLGLRGTMALLFGSREGAVWVGGKVLTKSDSAGRLGLTRERNDFRRMARSHDDCAGAVESGQESGIQLAKIEAERSLARSPLAADRPDVATLTPTMIAIKNMFVKSS